MSVSFVACTFCVIASKSLPHPRPPGGSDNKESIFNAGYLVRSLCWEDSPGEGNGNLLQYSCQENSMDRGGSEEPTVRESKRVRYDFHVTFQPKVTRTST